MKYLLLALTAVTLHGAVIRGTVVEHQTGKFLARTVVNLQPVGGTSAAAASTRTNLSGLFEFAGLPAGAYIVRVSRPGFLPAEYGQKRWNSAGWPIFMEEAQSAFLNIRMSRYAAISGTVLDEGDIGLPEHEVVAYRNSRPPEVAARAKSDERGVYRIPGLDPGTYFVRTTGAAYEEGAYVPTFARESIEISSARTVDVDLDQQANDMDVRPRLGKLFTVPGTVLTDPPCLTNPPCPPIPVKVTLATDAGRQSIVTTRTFQFTGIPPAPYELYAQAPAEDDPSVKLQGAEVQSDSLNRDAVHNLVLRVTRDMTFEFVGAPPRALATGAMQLLARRKDLAGDGPVQVARLVNNRLPLLAGRWELMLVPPAGYYVSGVSGLRQYRGDRSRVDGWNEIVVDAGGGFMRYTLSGGPGVLSGTVKSGTDPAIGAPVFLEPWDPESRQRLLEPRKTLTDMRGQYSFKDLAPGTYRVLATFEYRNPDAAAMDAANAESLHMDAPGAQQRDLSLYVIP